MKSCIFIKTWINDLPWLKYCLRSIATYYSAPEIILVADRDCKPTLDSWNTQATTIHYVPNHRNGYIQQQAIKLQAHKYTDAELILYVDSDTIFIKPTTINDFLVNGLIRLLCEPYSKLPPNVPWRAITEQTLGFDVPLEYMRCFPILHHRETLECIERDYPTLQDTLYRMKSRAFSEFNVMGAYAASYSDKYLLHNLDTLPPPENCAKQFWSWGGLTEEIEQEIKDYLCTSGKA